MFLSILRVSHQYWLVLSLPWRKPGQPALPSYSSLRTTVICPQLSRTFWGNHFFFYAITRLFVLIFTFPWNVYSFLHQKFKLLYFFSSAPIFDFQSPCAPSFHYALNLSLTGVAMWIHRSEEFPNRRKVISLDTFFGVLSIVLLVSLLHLNVYSVELQLAVLSSCNLIYPSNSICTEHTLTVT